MICPDDKDEYRRKQAADCRVAAELTTAPEVREAFLHLEQGWLQLLPEGEVELSCSAHSSKERKRRNTPKISRRKRQRGGIRLSMVR